MVSFGDDPWGFGTGQIDDTMIFFCGVFIPLSRLPATLQVLARGLPLTYAVEGLEAALLGTSGWPMALDLAALAGFTALLFALAAVILRQRAD